MLAQFVVGTLIGLQALGVGLTIGVIGKPRRPITPSVAVGTLVSGMLHIAALFYISSQL